MDTSGVEIRTIGFRGGMFDRFFPSRDPSTGPGWYVMGRNPAYSDRYRMLCARPDVPPRKVKAYNVKVRKGWTTKREAQKIADELNRRSLDCSALMYSVPLAGTRFKDAS